MKFLQDGVYVFLVVPLASLAILFAVVAVSLTVLSFAFAKLAGFEEEDVCWTGSRT